MKLSGDGFKINGHRGQIKICFVIMDTLNPHSKSAVHEVIIADGQEYKDTLEMIFSSLLDQLIDWQDDEGNYKLEVFPLPVETKEYKI